MQFKNWMGKKGLKVRDVSFFTGLHTNTIYAFCKEKNVEPETADTLQAFKRAFEQTPEMYALPQRLKEAVGA